MKCQFDQTITRRGAAINSNDNHIPLGRKLTAKIVSETITPKKDLNWLLLHNHLHHDQSRAFHPTN